MMRAARTRPRATQSDRTPVFQGAPRSSTRKHSIPRSRQQATDPDPERHLDATENATAPLPEVAALIEHVEACDWLPEAVLRSHRRDGPGGIEGTSATFRPASLPPRSEINPVCPDKPRQGTRGCIAANPIARVTLLGCLEDIEQVLDGNLHDAGNELLAVH